MSSVQAMTQGPAEANAQVFTILGEEETLVDKSKTKRYDPSFFVGQTGSIFICLITHVIGEVKHLVLVLLFRR